MGLYEIGNFDRLLGGVGTGYDPREPYRHDFRKDYARLIHCAAFRRLVGKTQLFPGWESDFFRNRLTHSLEVAQIAKSIATKINSEHPYFLKNPVNTDLVEIAGLAHDLGHPPFGHNGELALDYCMRNFGGFEGNAQTLRILTRIEKKATSDPDGYGVGIRGNDLRFGLDLTARALAAILKYDNVIPIRRRVSKSSHKVVKGYYASEIETVRWIKKCVVKNRRITGKFKSIECQIMDVADDIAYSTYDLEDAFRGQLLTPIEMLAAENELVDEVVDEINSHNDFRVSNVEVRTELLRVFFESIAPDEKLLSAIENSEYVDLHEIVQFVLRRYRTSNQTARIGYGRTQLTSDLVGSFIGGVEVTLNKSQPALSEVKLNSATRKTVEVLKRFAFVALIKSARLKVAEIRGQEIVETIFAKLSSDDGYHLLPSDYCRWYVRLRKRSEQMRVICDFVAGMTDRYAIEFYSRLTSETSHSIFKPM